MRALLLRAFEGADRLAIVDVPEPEPRPGQVRLRVAAAGVSYVDALIAEGAYQVRPTLPWIPGSECAGTIDAVGDGVCGLAAGDRVCALAWGGVLAEALSVDAANVAALPDDMDFDTAAVIRVAPTTAWHALVDRAAIRQGECVLVLGASGAIGHAAIQLGKALGAHVIACTSSDAKRADLLAAGADAVVSGEALRREVEALVGAKGVDVVIDPVGGAPSELAFRLLAWGGRHCVVGFASGETPALRLTLPLLAGASIVGVNVGRFTEAHPVQAADNLRRIFELYSSGKLTPLVGHRFALDDAADAFACARFARPSGRIVIRMHGD